MKEYKINILFCLVGSLLCVFLYFQNNDLSKGEEVKIVQNRLRATHGIATPELVRGNEIIQTVVLTSDLLCSTCEDRDECKVCFSLLIGTFERENNSQYHIEISQNDKRIEGYLYAGECIDNEYCPVCFESTELVNFNEGIAELTITSFATPGDGLAFWLAPGLDSIIASVEIPVHPIEIVAPSDLIENIPSFPLGKDFPLTQKIPLSFSSRRALKSMPSHSHTCVGILMATYERVNTGVVKAILVSDSTVFVDTLVDMSGMVDNDYMDICFYTGIIESLKLDTIQVSLNSPNSDLDNFVSAWITKDTINGKLSNREYSNGSLGVRITNKNRLTRSLNFISSQECYSSSSSILYIVFILIYCSIITLTFIFGNWMLN